MPAVTGSVEPSYARLVSTGCRCAQGHPGTPRCSWRQGICRSSPRRRLLPVRLGGCAGTPRRWRWQRCSWCAARTPPARGSFRVCCSSIRRASPDLPSRRGAIAARAVERRIATLARTISTSTSWSARRKRGRDGRSGRRAVSLQRCFSPAVEKPAVAWEVADKPAVLRRACLVAPRRVTPSLPRPVVPRSPFQASRRAPSYCAWPSD